jgi:hypothetical protein
MSSKYFLNMKRRDIFKPENGSLPRAKFFLKIFFDFFKSEIVFE